MSEFNAAGVIPEVEVAEKAVRRQFSAEYKRKILTEADACTREGAIGALLRREGLYSSHLTVWRAARERGAIAGLAPKKRGPKVTPPDPRDRKIVELERETRRLTSRLERAEALVDLQKKSLDAPGDRAARARRQAVMQTVADVKARLGVAPTCAALGLARSSFYRHQQPQPVSTPRRTPPRALSALERERALAVLHEPRFVDLAPAQVYTRLLDEDRYLCSERTWSRILAAHTEGRERRDQLRHPVYQKPEVLATAPNQVWSWDITKLLGPVTWTAFYLYVLLDIFSRYVTGWLLATQESAALAKQLIAETCRRQGIDPGQLTTHSDRGASMTSQPVALLLADLGVTQSLSRPHTSNDNPYSEAQFKTLKYRPDFPDRFGSLQDGRGFCRTFFGWYNTEHHHSGIGMLTPEAVHSGRAPGIIAARQHTLDTAFALHPERFVRNPPRHQEVPHQAWINPPKASTDLQGAPGSTIVSPADLRTAVPMNLLQTEVGPRTQRVVH